MAYPTVSAPYGLKPVNLVGGRVFAGATRQFPIASGYAANIFNGDVVKLINDGTIEKDTGTATATPVGVFVGCSYTSPALGYQLFSQYYPTGTVASDIVAYVVDDPDALFKVAVTAAGTATIATGDSKISISSTTATTNTQPMRIIDVVPETATGADAFVEVIVKWNWGMHQYQNATGV